MDRTKQDSMKQLPIKTCPYCGGTWFREVPLDRYLPPDQQDLTRAWGSPTGAIGRMPMTVLVCLCGEPFRPPIGGIRGGHTPNAELSGFFKSLGLVDRVEGFRKNWHEESIAQDFAPKQDVEVLRREASAMELRVGRLLEPRTCKDKKSGRHWQVPKRERASKSKGRDWLALELQKQGFTYDKAREVVDAIFGSMVDALQAGECVETPIGDFEIKRRTRPHHRVRFGKVQRMHVQPKRVVFRARKPCKGDSK